MFNHSLFGLTIKHAEFLDGNDENFWELPSARAALSARVN